MHEPIANSQPEIRNENEENEGECPVGEFTVLPGPSNVESRKDMPAIVVIPESRVEEQQKQPHSPIPASAPSKRKRDDPAAKAVSLLESIAKCGSTVKERTANEKFCIYVAAQLDAMTKVKQRIARNQIQAIISELEGDESDTE